jgi:hypothetical protein
MPKLTLNPSKLPLIKAILLAYSGMGKSTSTISLGVPGIVKDFPGFELRVLDADGKYEEVVRSTLLAWRDSKKISETQYTEAFDHFDICRIREDTGITAVGFGGKDTPKGIGSVGQPTAWRKATDQLGMWQPSWDDKKILLIDSLTHISQSIAAWCQAMNNRTNKALNWRDYMVPQQRVIDLMTLAADIDSHCIITGHQAPLEIRQKTGEVVTNDDGSKEELDELVESAMAPISIGRAIRIQIPTQFNHQLVLAQTLSGERRVFTTSEDGVVTKTPFWARAKPSYPIDTGLAEYFMLRS